MGKFVIKNTSSGVRFVLKATNGQVILVSETYSGEGVCLKGIDSVKRSCEGGVEDLLRLAELVRTAERLGLLGDAFEVLGIDARLERDAVGAVQLDVCIDALRPEELLGL